MPPSSPPPSPTPFPFLPSPPSFLKPSFHFSAHALSWHPSLAFRHWLSAPSSLSAPFDQTELNGGPLFGPVWPNRGPPFSQVWLNRGPLFGKALHSIIFSQTEALHSAKQDRMEALHSVLFRRTMPKGRGMLGAREGWCRKVEGASGESWCQGAGGCWESMCQGVKERCWGRGEGRGDGREGGSARKGEGNDAEEKTETRGALLGAMSEGGRRWGRRRKGERRWGCIGRGEETGAGGVKKKGEGSLENLFFK